MTPRTHHRDVEGDVMNHPTRTTMEADARTAAITTVIVAAILWVLVAVTVWQFAVIGAGAL